MQKLKKILCLWNSKNFVSENKIFNKKSTENIMFEYFVWHKLQHAETSSEQNNLWS